MVGQKIQHFGGVGDVAFHAQTQCFDTLDQMESVGGRQAGADVIHAFGAHTGDKCGGAVFFVQIHALEPEMGLGQGWKTIVLTPVEIAAVNDGTAQRDTVAAHPFGQGMDHDVCAVFQWF